MNLFTKRRSRKEAASYSAEAIKSEDVGRFREERNTEALCAGLSSPDLGVRYEAADALGDLKDPAAALELSRAGDEAAMADFLVETSREEAHVWAGT
ncbi:MAG: hypothetical protein OES13_05695 [Acidimicrobiia bacterium]|nr:hypothetical protein [Acidimicrobiia bacterium]